MITDDGVMNRSNHLGIDLRTLLPTDEIDALDACLAARGAVVDEARVLPGLIELRVSLNDGKTVEMGLVIAFAPRQRRFSPSSRRW